MRRLLVVVCVSLAVSVAAGRQPAAGADASGSAEATQTAAGPTSDPDLKPGWPADVFVGPGTYSGGPVVHALVGSIDDDPRLEVLTTGLAAGPLHAYHSDGTPVTGWPVQTGIWSSYPALGDLTPGSGRGFDVAAGWWQTYDAGSPIAGLRGDGELLPGWPREVGNGTYAPPVITDLDGDGAEEVIADNGYNRLDVRDRFGVKVPWWAEVPAFSRQQVPAVADLDGDGRKEVVVAGTNGTADDASGVAVKRWDGSTLSGWPVLFSGTRALGFNSFPVVGDVTGDGLAEIVVVMAQSGTGLGLVQVVDPRTKAVRSWTARANAPFSAAAALADVDADGVLDIVTQTDGALDVHRGNGAALAGFPVLYGGGPGHERAENSSPVVGDLDGDGGVEIAFMSLNYPDGTGRQRVHVYRRDGTPHPRFPKVLGDGQNSTPAIADLDLDGRNELVAVNATTDTGVAGMGAAVWAWDLRGGQTAPPPWGQYRGGPRHEGVPSARTAPPQPPTSSQGPGPARLVSDLTPGSSEPQELTPFAGGVAFTARHPTSGRELWWTDGTATGTRLLADLRPGTASSGVRELTVVGDALYVVADDGVSGAEPWRVTRTGAASLVRDVRGGSRSSRPEQLTGLGTRLYFSAEDGSTGQELWRSDGTPTGTVLTTDLNPGVVGSFPRGLSDRDGVLYFASYGPSGPDTTGNMWRSLAEDGTLSQGRYVSGEGAPVPLATAPPYFAAIDRVGSMTTSCDPEPFDPAWAREIVAVGTRVAVAGRTNLYSSCERLLPWSQDQRLPLHLVTDGTTVWFTAHGDGAGRELWRSDLTPAGSRQLADLRAGAGSSHPSDLTLRPDGLLMTADAGAAGREPWLVDPVTGTHRLLHDVAAGPAGSDPRWYTATTTGTFFTADDGVHGRELWILPPTLPPPPARPVLTVGDVTVPEGHAGSAAAVVPVRLSSPSTETVTAAYATAAGTAGTADYRSASGTVRFPPGTTSRLIALTVLGDSVDEPTEAFTLDLSAPQGAGLGDARGAVTVADDDAPPRLSAGDVRIWEGNGGTAAAYVTVRLSAPAAGEVAVQYATAGSTATSGRDFTAKTGTLTVAAGQLSRTVAVSVRSDTADEAHEAFGVRLSGLTGPATIADAEGLVTVLDDDPGMTSSTPNLRVGDLRLTEGHHGSTAGRLTVRLSAPRTTAVSATYRLIAGTAGPADFTATTGTVTIPAGAAAATIPVTVRGDALDEPTETFTATLSSPSGATLGDAGGTVAVVDDDGAPRLAVSDVALAEGHSGSGGAAFTIRLSAPAANDVTVTYTTADGTASAGSDYTARTGTVTFAAGQVSTTIVVSNAGDTAVESNETFLLRLANPVGAALSDSSGLATLRNDDP